MTSRKTPSRLFASTAVSVLFLAGIATQAQNQFSAASPAPTILHFADGGDLPGRMTTDAAGNIYIATLLGPSTNKPTFGIVKYSFNGNKEQTIRDVPASGEFGGFGRAVKVDAQGNLYVAGSSSIGGKIVSFTPAGKLRWSNHFDTVDTSFAATSVVLDTSANVYVGGFSLQSGNGLFEWTVAKYTSTGKLLWQQHHLGRQLGNNLLTDIALDASGNVFALGSTNNVGAFLKRDLTLVKYDSQGHQLFVRNFSGTPKSDQTPGALAVDNAGDTYVTAITSPTGPEGDQIPVTLKYDKNGKLLFKLQGDGMGGSFVSLDPSGNVLLSGTAFHPGVPLVISASKFTPAGVKVWINSVPAPGKIVSDSAGKVYLATVVPGPDFLILEFSPGGTLLSQFTTPPGDRVTDAVIDPFDNFIMTGTGANALFEEDIYTVRFP